MPASPVQSQRSDGRGYCLPDGWILEIYPSKTPILSDCSKNILSLNHLTLVLKASISAFTGSFSAGPKLGYTVGEHSILFSSLSHELIFFMTIFQSASGAKRPSMKVLRGVVEIMILGCAGCWNKTG